MHTLTSHKFLLISLLLIGTSLTTKSQNTDVVPDELIIKWKTNRKGRINSMYPNALTIKGKRIKEINGTNIEVWKLPIARENELSVLIQQYKNHPDIEFIEPNYIYKSFELIPNDPLFNEQWGLENMGQAGSAINADIAATDAWEIQHHSRSVKVAITDSGIDWTHPDLVQNIWQNLAEDIDGDGTVLEWTGTQWIFDPDDENGIDDDGNGYVDDFIGWDFRDNDNNPMDFDGHGTHVAGIVGARGDNGLGISGVTWEVQLVPLRIIGNGSLRVADAIEAIHYATLMNIPISNNSWGGKTFSFALFNAIKEAAYKNHLCVTAAGNDSLNTDIQPIYPASFSLDNIINVAASDTLDTNSNFKVGSSNFGQNSVDIYAPGFHILSCLPNGTYGARSGTSMAAPYIAGTCALVKELFPYISYQELRTNVLNGVTPISHLTGQCVSGGRLNLFNILSQSGVNCTYRDSLALVALYNTTNGANWTNQWDLTTPINTWYGITVNSDGCVDSIDLKDNYLAGIFPLEIRNLQALKYLNLSNNIIQGNIPVSIGELIVLTHLELNNNEISGTIPNSIANLNQLTYLGLGNNNLSGFLPDIFENLNDLKRLYLNNNQLVGMLPNSLNYSFYLEHLYLNDNQFSGNLNIFDQGSNHLEKLYVNNNKFSGFIPWLVDLQTSISLKEVNFSNNQLSGCYSSNLSFLCEKNYDFSGNPNLPENGNFERFCTDRIGECTDCTITDSLALVALYNATGGSNWNITWDLNQPIDTWYGISTNLEGCVTKIQLKNNGLIGNLPPEIGQIRLLSVLHLQNNKLDGIIPKEIGQNFYLRQLYLSSNELSGEIPPELGKLINLTDLVLVNNQLMGSIPPELGNLGNLTQLSLVLNKLSDTIPNSIGLLRNLGSLQLSFNQLTGRIPATLGNLTKLHNFELSSNQLSDTIPLELGQLNNLSTLDISYNQLSGNIPSKIFSISSLFLLRLGNNQLTGNIPTELISLINLGELDLSNNQLTGGIPIGISNLTNLWRLRLSYNQLTGNLPPDLFTLNKLHEVYLNNNNLSGCYPESLVQFCFRTMNLGNNPNLPNQGYFCNRNQEGICTAPVYPGDFNNDGIANKEDVLYWALAQSNTGIPRPNASTEWYGQECPDWEVTILEVDNKHQDGDGNGIINEADLEVLEMNYGKVHGYTPFTSITNGTTYELTTINFMEDTLQIALNLDVGGVSTSLHGIAASIDFGDLGIDNILFDFSNSALNPSHHLVMYDEVNNVLDIALTRTNKQDTICAGEMGILWIIMADGIDLDDEISIAAKNGSMVQADGNINAIGDAVMFSTYSLPTSNNNLVSSISFSSVACDQLGAAMVTVNGGTPPYTYQWNTGETSASITGLTEGNYKVTVTDAHGLMKDYSIEIEGQYIPVYDENGELIDCNPTSCQSNLILENSFENKTYQAASSIQAIGIITASNEVIFKAADSILLQSGFTVEAGGSFQALIEDCTTDVSNHNENINQFSAINSNKNTNPTILNTLASTSKKPNIHIYPNPMYQNALIEYDIPIATKLNLTLTGIQGQSIQVLQKNFFVTAGKHQYLFDGSQLSNGLYMIHLQTDKALLTHKLILLK